MNCPKCLEGRHIRCEKDGCTCSLCSTRASGKWETDTTPRPTPKAPRPVKELTEIGEKRKRTAAEMATRKRSTPRAAAKSVFGVFTDLSKEDVETIFREKAEGTSISALSRSLGVSRDRVRTVYYSPLAPDAGTPKTGGHMESEHLGKAKGALDHARMLMSEHEDLFSLPDMHKEYLGLLDVAAVQAAVASAEGTLRIAAALERQNARYEAEKAIKHEEILCDNP